MPSASTCARRTEELDKNAISIGELAVALVKKNFFTCVKLYQYKITFHLKASNAQNVQQISEFSVEITRNLLHRERIEPIRLMTNLRILFH